MSIGATRDTLPCRRIDTGPSRVIPVTGERSATLRRCDLPACWATHSSLALQLATRFVSGQRVPRQAPFKIPAFRVAMSRRRGTPLTGDDQARLVRPGSTSCSANAAPTLDTPTGYSTSFRATNLPDYSCHPAGHSRTEGTAETAFASATAPGSRRTDRTQSENGA